MQEIKKISPLPFEKLVCGFPIARLGLPDQAGGVADLRGVVHFVPADPGKPVFGGRQSPFSPRKPDHRRGGSFPLLEKEDDGGSGRERHREANASTLSRQPSPPAVLSCRSQDLVLGDFDQSLPQGFWSMIDAAAPLAYSSSVGIRPFLSGRGRALGGEKGVAPGVSRIFFRNAGRILGACRCVPAN